MPHPKTDRPGRALVLALAALIAVAPSACKRSGSGASAMTTKDAQMATRQLPGAKKETLSVASSAFASGGTIPDKYSAYHEGVSPPLTWTPVVDAHSYALIVEDPDAPSAQPFVHWVAWNIPGDTASLPENLAAAGAPQGMQQGKSGAGNVGWFGPRPPAGPAHHYHFQVFALDTPSLNLAPGADRAALVAAMKGHVAAEGELVGLYQSK
jgi:Raf kinase inhibitor-like YbhB/YbcL family protein